MNEKIITLIVFFILLVCLVSVPFIAAVPAPVEVVVDSVGTTLFYLNSLGQAISTAQNTLAAIEYQKQSLKSLSEGSLEGYSDFLAYQSLSTGAINATIDNYKNTEALVKFAGTDNEKSPDIYKRITAGESVDGVQYKKVNEELTQELEDIEDAEWTSSKVLADIDDYVMKTRMRQQQLRRIDKDKASGEVDSLQKMSQLLGLMADQNEDTIQLLYTQNLYEGTKNKLKRAEEERVKAKARATAEKDAGYYDDFGSSIFGEGSFDIEGDVKKQLDEIERNNKRKKGYGL